MRCRVNLRFWVLHRFVAGQHDFFTRHLPAPEIGVQEALQYKISAKKRCLYGFSSHRNFQHTVVPLQFIKLSFFRPLEYGERA